MILAHKILLPTLEKKDPELEGRIRVPDTWYLNSGVFSEFLDRNNLYLFHTFKYKDRESIEKDFLRIEEQFKFATFAPEVVEDFRRILEEIGDHPIIVRSSSMLEDNFGLAFSGKYMSVFLTNQGDLETRLSRFIVGLKKVFASTFGPDPILYRRDHGLLDYDERMAMVVQKVVGRRFGDYFYPFAAGVMFSRNVYAWNPKINKETGLVRLVHGLGTRAVDRVGSDYPRMVPLSHPTLRPEVTADQIRKYSQKQVDVLNLKKRRPGDGGFPDPHRVGHSSGPLLCGLDPGPRSPRRPALQDAGVAWAGAVPDVRQSPRQDSFCPVGAHDSGAGGSRLRTPGRHRVRAGPGHVLSPSVPFAVHAQRATEGRPPGRHSAGARALHGPLDPVQQRGGRPGVHRLREPACLR